MAAECRNYWKNAFASEGNLTLNVIDPEPFSEEEHLATQFGIRAVPVSQGGDSIYFGLVASQVWMRAITIHWPPLLLKHYLSFAPIRTVSGV